VVTARCSDSDIAGLRLFANLTMLAYRQIRRRNSFDDTNIWTSPRAGRGLAIISVQPAIEYCTGMIALSFHELSFNLEQYKMNDSKPESM
jgi:hypothetical protein